MDLTEYPVKLYNNKRMAERIQDEVLNDYPDKKGKKSIPPIITDVLAGCIGGIKKPLDLLDLEQKVNNLQKGSMEDKAVYLVFRQQLIDYDCMPVDEEGKPYDLSLMFIPTFNVDAFLDGLNKDNPELLNKTLLFYSGYATSKEPTNGEFIECISKLKTESPSTYVQLYKHMTDKKIIPHSPMLQEINLTADQFSFIAHYDKAIADEDASEAVVPAIIDYVTGHMSGPGTIEEINKTIATMRYGSYSEQNTYNKFCKIARGLPINMPEHPTVQEQREKLLAKAERKAKAQLEQKV